MLKYFKTALFLKFLFWVIRIIASFTNCGTQPCPCLHHKETKVEYIIVICLGLIVAIEYACAVASKKADEEAEELLKRYKEYKDNGVHTKR